MSVLEECVFDSSYIIPGSTNIGDEQTKETPFKCHLRKHTDVEYSSFCRFHDPRYLETPNVHHSERVASDLYHMVDEVNSTEPDLLCVGYHLPSFSLRNKTFPGKVVFHNAVFHGSVDFSNSTFEGQSSFLGAQFKTDSSFYDTTFIKPITFQGAKFENTAYFEKTRFQEGVDFSKTRFAGETIFDNAIFHGEANYSFCKILGEARFISTNFDGLSHMVFSNIYLKDPEHVTFEPF